MISDLISPRSTEDSIKAHLRYYYGQLKSNNEFKVASLFHTYLLSHPSLHKLVNAQETDVSALSYAIPRLPPCIYLVKNIIIAQSTDQLDEANIDISSWEVQSASARRRRNYFDSKTSTLIVMINSESDIDDFISCLIAFQIERLKISKLNSDDIDDVSHLGLNAEDWSKYVGLLSPNKSENFKNYCQYKDITIRSLQLDNKFTQDEVSKWYQNLSTSSLVFDFEDTPVYFISSNLHSLSNLIGGFVNHKQDGIISHIEKKYPALYQQWLDIKNGHNNLRVIDFLYYISGKYFKDLSNESTAKLIYEESLGIKSLRIKTQLPCITQLIPVSAIARSQYKDPNLNIKNPQALLNSKAYILNIEYPLGLLAYFIMQQMLKELKQLKGVYIIGKAAMLTSEIGDILIPNVVFDERLNNVFHPKNVFNEYFPFTAYQTAILKNQKAISVYGTFLENEAQLHEYISSGFNIIEMETGPYLAAIYQKLNEVDKIPQNIVSKLIDLPFDLGIINYASDNPLSQTLGDSTMSLAGVEPTYLAALTTIQRIIDLESL